jgi:hypothetical protein
MNFKKGISLGIIVNFIACSIAFGYTIEALPNIEVVNDFVVGPTKTEIIINPGETSIKNITIVNRFEQQMKFALSIEDFIGTENEKDSIVSFLKDENSPYSLKDFISIDTNEVVLQHGDRANIPVTIKIPEGTQPGGLYAAVMVKYQTTDPLEEARIKEMEAKSGVSFISRIASLYFVRIPGEIFEEGELLKFTADKNIYKSGPIKLDWTFKNSGNVYENPYGIIEIKNLYGTTVERFTINPYYVMPNVSRTMTKVWDREFTMGRYKATLKLNRGYGDIIDEKTVVFWVLPIKMVAGILVGLFLLLVIIRAIRKWFRKNFEYKGGKNKNQAPPQS